MKIACVGDNCIDYYRETGKMYPGGNAVNVAGYIRRLGEESAYIGPVGDDAFGRAITEALMKKGVDVSHVRLEDGSTAVSYVAVVNGERVFTGFEEGVMADFRPGEDDIDFICTHDLAVAGVWGHAESALPAIRETSASPVDRSETRYTFSSCSSRKAEHTQPLVRMSCAAAPSRSSLVAPSSSMSSRLMRLTTTRPPKCRLRPMTARAIMRCCT